jgi:hypothetical protein
MRLLLPCLVAATALPSMVLAQQCLFTLEDQGVEYDL